MTPDQGTAEALAALPVTEIGHDEPKSVESIWRRSHEASVAHHILSLLPPCEVPPPCWTGTNPSAPCAPMSDSDHVALAVPSNVLETPPIVSVRAVWRRVAVAALPVTPIHQVPDAPPPVRVGA